MKYVTRGIFVLSLFVIQSSSAYALTSISTGPKTPAHATTTPATVIARVNVQNCLLNANKENLTITCDFNNQGEVQTGIKYAVDLIQGEGTSTMLVDEKVYDETFSLAPGQSLKKVITYTIPSYVNGAVVVYVRAANTEGLPLSQTRVGNTNHLATGGALITLCYLTVNGDKNTRYMLSQGIDLSPTESLTAHCDVKNLDNKDVKVQAVFTTHKRNSFGAVVETPVAPATDLTLLAGKTTTISFDVPHSTTPQAYGIDVSLVNGSAPVSNTYSLYYVLRGASATIQNLTIDKLSYQKGDIAIVTAFWIGPTDSFPGSRGAGTSNSASTLSASIESHGAVCGEVTQPTIAAKGNLLTTVAIPVSRNCIDPTVILKILDKDGQILAEKTIDIPSNLGKPSIYDNLNPLHLLALLLGLLLTVGTGYLLFQKRKKGAVPPNLPTDTTAPPISKIMPVLIFSMLASGYLFFSSAPLAHADTYTDSLGYSFTVTYDKTAYAPGDTMNVSSQTYSSTGVPGGGAVVAYQCNYVGVSIPATAESHFLAPSYPNGFACTGNYLYTATASFTVPANAITSFGVHFINHQSGGSTNGGNYSLDGTYDTAIPVVVTNPAPTATLSASPSSIVSGNSSTLSYSCTNSTSATIDQGVGSVSATSGTSPVSPGVTTTYTLTCTGAGGTTQAQATVTVSPPPVNGSCGTTNNACVAGTAVHDTDTSTQYLWHCNGSNGGTNSGQCSATIPVTTVNGACGSANGVVVYSAPSSGLCNAGSQTAVSGSGPWSWSCTGSGGGSPASCSAPVASYNGICGPANGQTYSSAPSSGLCSQGANSSVTGTYNWTCFGGNGGSNAPCSASYAASAPDLTAGGVTSSASSGSCSAAIGYQYTYVTQQPSQTYVPPTGVQITGPYAGLSAPKEQMACTSLGYTFTDEQFESPQSNRILPNTCYEYYNALGSIYTFDGAGQEKVRYYSKGSGSSCSGGSTIPVGSPTTLTSIISNIGSASTGTTFTDLFQKATDALGTGAVDIGTFANATLGAGGTTNATLSYTFSSAGTYYIRACADKQSAAGTGVIAESNETNNCGAWTAVTAGTALPDLTPIGLVPTTVVAGAPATFTATMRNGGTANTPVFASTIYVCATGDTACTSSIAQADTSFLSKVLAYVKTAVAHAATAVSINLTGPAISAGAQGTQTGTYTFATPGSYQMKLCADLPANVVAESNENDNCGVWQALAVCPSGNTVDALGNCVAPGQADLTAGDITPTTATAGTPTTLQATASNIGTGASGSFPVLFQVQSPATLVASSYVPAIPAGGSAPSSASYTFPSAGSYQVRACANNNTSWVNIVTESNYGNNCGNWTTVTVGAPSGPTITSCTPSPASVPLNTPTTWTVNVSGFTKGAPTVSWIGGGTPGSGTAAPTGPDGITFTFSSRFSVDGNYSPTVLASNAPWGGESAGPFSCTPVTAGTACNGTPTGPAATATPNRIRANVATGVTFTIPSISNVKTSCTLAGPGIPTQTYNANSCTASGTYTANLTIATQSVYTLTCDGVKMPSVIVNVIPNFVEF